MSPTSRHAPVCRPPRTVEGNLRQRRHDDRGSVTAEQVLVMPLVLTLVLLFAQATIWLHATHIAQATAAHALSVTRVQGGTTSAGRDDAQQLLDQLGRGSLRGAHIDVARGANQAEVRISGTAVSIVPFLHLPVRAHVAGAVERFRPTHQAAP